MAGSLTLTGTMVNNIHSGDAERQPPVRVLPCCGMSVGALGPSNNIRGLGEDGDSVGDKTNSGTPQIQVECHRNTKKGYQGP